MATCNGAKIIKPTWKLEEEEQQRLQYMMKKLQLE